MFSIDEYITEIRIPKDCTFINRKVSEIEKYTEDRLTIIRYIAQNGEIHPPQHDRIIEEEDRFQIQADPVDLKLMMDEYGLRLTKKMRERIDHLKDDGTAFNEVLITPDYHLVNRNRQFFRS